MSKSRQSSRSISRKSSRAGSIHGGDNNDE